MRKKEAIMNLMLGFILSFSLSLVGTIRGGHFTMSSWLISFTISFVTAQVIAQLVPYKMLIDDMCKKKKISNNSVKGILLGALIVDLSYTPIMSTTMASLMGWLSAKKAPVGAVPPLYKTVPVSVFTSFILAFFIAIFSLPIIYSVIDKIKDVKNDEAQTTRNRIVYVTTILLVLSFAVTSLMSVFSIDKIINSENRNMAELLANNIREKIYTELDRQAILGRVIASDGNLIELMENEKKYTDAQMEELLGGEIGRYANRFDSNTVFLISDATHKYYTQDGFNKVVSPESDSHDAWYTAFMANSAEYNFEVDIDETNDYIWTVFVNVKLVDDEGNLLGVCGVGTQMSDMNQFVADMQSKYDVKIRLNNGELRENYIETGSGYMLSMAIPELESSIAIQRNVDSFGILMRTLFSNIVVFLIVFILFIIIATILLNKSSSMMARNIQFESYETLKKMFDGVYILDAETGLVSEIKNLLSGDDHFCDPAIPFEKQRDQIIEKWIDESSWEAFRKLLDSSNREEKFANRNSKSMQFITNGIGWCQGMLVAVKDKKTSEIDHLIFTVKIIDEEVRRENEMRQETADAKAASEAAKAASEAKGKFLANVSHEIRTPINAVLGMDTMILRECNEPKIKEYALSIQNAGNTLLSLINDILDISKIESGKMDIVPVEYDISSLIMDVINMIRLKANSQGLAFNLNIDENLPVSLFGDDIRIRQVLLNIMNNAVKYTNEGSITFTATGVREGNYVTIHFSVKDTGIGIKSEDMGKLFADFERIEESRNRSVEGTGLGMSITMQLLKLMDSKLEVSSVYGEGSDFYFDLKQEIRNPDPVGNFAQRISQKSAEYEYSALFAAPDANIIIIDDNQTNRIVFSKLLSETEIKIDEAENGVSGLEKILNEKYDIIFLDHMMPDMDGMEVIEAFKSKVAAGETTVNADTPIIALTANAISGVKEKYIEAGFADYLAKPIIPEKLERMIARLIPDEKKQAPKKREKKQNIIKIDYVEGLPNIEGVDWNFAALHFADKEMLLATVENYYLAADLEREQLRELYERIKSNVEDKEAIDLFRIKIHALKSSSALLGIVPIAGAAALLEYAARAKNVDYIMDVTPYFLESFASYKEKLAELIDNGEGDKKEDFEPAEIIDCLKRLKDAADEVDVTAMDEIFSHIAEYKYSSDVEEILVRLKVAVNNIDTDGVMAAADEMMGEIKNNASPVDSI